VHFSWLRPGEWRLRMHIGRPNLNSAVFPSQEPSLVRRFLILSEHYLCFVSVSDASSFTS